MRPKIIEASMKNAVLGAINGKNVTFYFSVGIEQIRVSAANTQRSYRSSVFAARRVGSPWSTPFKPAPSLRLCVPAWPVARGSAKATGPPRPRNSWTGNLRFVHAADPRDVKKVECPEWREVKRNRLAVGRITGC